MHKSGASVAGSRGIRYKTDCVLREFATQLPQARLPLRSPTTNMLDDVESTAMALTFFVPVPPKAAAVTPAPVDRDSLTMKPVRRALLSKVKPAIFVVVPCHDPAT